MDGTKHNDEQTTLDDMPETGGDVRARESGQNENQDQGTKGGQALQEQQEEESYQEFKVGDQQSEDKSNESSESEDLWGQE